ncbi:isochorismatase family protein [Salinigranum halophilum]|uniref:isochorismatase family protein n=1 Tax=Salinigranum halophilum TaxID=2565931 RepID=UPI00115F2310|nr:isochorismatase family protein [Salinigranum halophilum]
MAGSNETHTSEATQAVYERASMDTRVGYGTTPALVVVDLQVGFTDSESPLGGDLTGVVDRTNDLLDAAHDTDVPVVFTRIVSTHPDHADFGIWQAKIPRLDTLKAGSRWVDIDERLHRADEDHVLDKRQASAFHETELASMLVAWGVDTVVVTGCTTSGCIRATVVDACAHGYRTIVPGEAVGDRAPEPHESNVFDMDAKYADVRPVGEVADYLRGADVDGLEQ